MLSDVFNNSPSRVEVTTPDTEFRWDQESENLVFAPLDEVQLIILRCVLFLVFILVFRTALRAYLWWKPHRRQRFPLGNGRLVLHLIMIINKGRPSEKE